MAVVAAAATACGPDAAAHAGDSAPARRLSGEWDARFHGTVLPRGGVADDTVVPGHGPDGRTDARGTLAFVPNHRLEHAAGIDMPTNVGTFDVDFTPLGFDARDPARPPAAAARAVGADSVQLVLGPGGPGPVVAMWGAWSGDSLVGRWRVDVGRASGGGGTFVLVRQAGATHAP